MFYKIAHCHPLIWKVKTRNLQICTVDIWPEKLKNVKREILCPEPNNKWLNCTQLILQNCSFIFRANGPLKPLKFGEIGPTKVTGLYNAGFTKLCSFLNILNV